MTYTNVVDVIKIKKKIMWSRIFSVTKFTMLEHRVR